MAAQIEMSRMMLEMRALKQQVQGDISQPVNTPLVDRILNTTEASINESGEGFGKMLKQAIDQVNDAQSHTSALRTAFEKGDPGVDLPEVMIASQKSSIAFSAMTEVRNKLLTAYEEIMKMPV